MEIKIRDWGRRGACGAERHVLRDDAFAALMSPGAIVGLPVETWEDVEEAEVLSCDYIGVSRVFATPAKIETKGAWGLGDLARIRHFSRHRLVAIGGIDASNAAQVMEAGAHCLAVVSAICAAGTDRSDRRNIGATARDMGCHVENNLCRILRAKFFQKYSECQFFATEWR